MLGKFFLKDDDEQEEEQAGDRNEETGGVGEGGHADESNADNQGNLRVHILCVCEKSTSPLSAETEDMSALDAKIAEPVSMQGATLPTVIWLDPL